MLGVLRSRHARACPLACVQLAAAGVLVHMPAGYSMAMRNRYKPSSMPPLPALPLWPNGHDIQHKRCFLVEISGFDKVATERSVTQMEVLKVVGFAWKNFTGHGPANKFKPGTRLLAAECRAICVAGMGMSNSRGRNNMPHGHSSHATYLIKWLHTALQVTLPRRWVTSSPYASTHSCTTRTLRPPSSTLAISSRTSTWALYCCAARAAATARLPSCRATPASAGVLHSNP